MGQRTKIRKPETVVRRILMHDRRITIPKDFRDFLGIREGCLFEISIEGERIVFQVITR